MKKLVAALFAVAISTVFACSSSDDHDHTTGEHESEFPSCQAIMEKCHPLDKGPGAIHDCHEVAHDDPTEEKCAAKKNECLATCVESSDAGSADATAD